MLRFSSLSLTVSTVFNCLDAVCSNYIPSHPSTVTEHLDREKMTLTCSVITQERCKHRVKWLFNGTDVKPETKIAEETSTSCSAAVTFNPTHYVKTTWSHLFKCELKTGADKLQLFSLSPHPPGETPQVMDFKTSQLCPH